MSVDGIDVCTQPASGMLRLGEILVGQGAVTAERLETALLEQRRRPGARIGTLLDPGDGELSRALAAQFALPWAEQVPAPAGEWLELVPRELLDAGLVLPVRREGATLTVAIADPSDPDVLERVAVHSGLEVHAVVVPASTLQATAYRGRADRGSLSGADWARLSDEPDGVEHLDPSSSLDAITEEALADATGLARGELGLDTHSVAMGCGQCNGTGYRGRRPVFEMMPMTDEVREAILAGAASIRLRSCALATGMCELRERALALVRSGETSLEELARVTRHEH
ncbi:MAG: hypothetical protein HY814_07520 [Candidatus Riflebacteria bacterium]|nr:hypothetical protein [Candidatus Riflebacteria bacterium]